MKEHPLVLTEAIRENYRLFYRLAHEYEMGRYGHCVDLLKTVITRIETMHLKKDKNALDK